MKNPEKIKKNIFYSIQQSITYNKTKKRRKNERTIIRFKTTKIENEGRR